VNGPRSASPGDASPLGNAIPNPSKCRATGSRRRQDGPHQVDLRFLDPHRPGRDRAVLQGLRSSRRRRMNHPGNQMMAFRDRAAAIMARGAAAPVG
jgi:hypothetical protein